MDKNKTPYNPEIHNRHSLRLPNYDYSQQGAYFITICAQDRAFLFGEINDDQMCLNEAGKMVREWWLKVALNFLLIELDEYVIMPNHFHAIILIKSGIEQEVAPTLSRTMEWFKTMTTNAYIRGVKQAGWPPFNGRVWQRNYFERIIRDEHALELAREYIVNNPLKWAFDKENPHRIKQ